MTFLTDEEVAERAQRWARFHKMEKYREKMDEVLKGLEEIDQRRVYLCGQRMVGGLPLKVIPAPAQPRKEDKNGDTKTEQRQQPKDAAVKSAGKVKGKISVGANSSAAKGGHRRARSRGKK